VRDVEWSTADTNLLIPTSSSSAWSAFCLCAALQTPQPHYLLGRQLVIRLRVSPFRPLDTAANSSESSLSSSPSVTSANSSSLAVDAFASVLPPNIAISLAATTLAVKGVRITLRERRPDVVDILPWKLRAGVVTRPVHRVLLVAAPVGNADGLAIGALAVGQLGVTL
jgi:hypothetical protein